MSRAAKLSDIAEADVVDLAEDGRGIARSDGKAVFIEGALPGERVRFRVFKRRRALDEAGLVDVLRASPDRVTPLCMHFGVCGGCALQHLSADAQVAIKQSQLLDALRRIGQVNPRSVLAPLCGPAWGYRRRARLGIKFVHKKGRVLAGFRERDTPYLADIRRCEVLLEPLATLPQALAELVQSLAACEAVRQVEVAGGDEHVALVFRIMQPPGEPDVAKLAAFGAARGLQIFLQTGGLDSVRAVRNDYPPLEYRIDAGRVAIEFGPVDFVQVNAAINARMVDAAVELLAPEAQDCVLDLFCGLGNFTLPLARRARKVRGVEGDAGLVAKARRNAERHGLDNVEFAVENLFEPAALAAWADERHDLVLLDPPRAGAASLLPRLRQWRPRRVVYISCHPGSFARDARILVSELGFELSSAGVMDMFPHTTHVESIAVFEQPA